VPQPAYTNATPDEARRPFAAKKPDHNATAAGYHQPGRIRFIARVAVHDPCNKPDPAGVGNGVGGADATRRKPLP
jgi:hypothetical protein